MKPIRLILTIALVVVLFALTALVAAAQSGGTAAVDAADFEFVAKTITVEAGTTITWTNTGVQPHTVTASDGSFDSGQFQSGETYSLTFDEVGTVPYYCTLHGTAAGAGMAGTVVVVAAPEPTPEPIAEPTPAPESDDDDTAGATEESAETTTEAAPETMPETGSGSSAFAWAVGLLGALVLGSALVARRARRAV